MGARASSHMTEETLCKQLDIIGKWIVKRHEEYKAYKMQEKLEQAKKQRE
jgi:hypothetical protein